MKDFHILYWIEAKDFIIIKNGLIEAIRSNNIKRSECKKQRISTKNAFTEENKELAKIISKITKILNDKKACFPLRILNPTLSQSFQNQQTGD